MGVLVLLRRRFSELAWFLAAEAMATLGVQVWDGLNRIELAGFLAVLAWSTGAQVAVAAGVRALDAAAGQAAAAARSEHAARERAATAELIRAARQARWLALQESADPAGRGAGGGNRRPWRPAGARPVRGPGGPAAPAAGRGRRSTRIAGA